MGRIINPDSAGKLRNQHMRTVAEIVRHLSQKQTIDDETKDMVATLIYCFREIDEGIEVSAEAWEKRDYWVKADELRQRWNWPGRLADDLLALVLAEGWNDLPARLVKIIPYVNDIKVTKLTRKPDEWLGNYARLLREREPGKS
jgi:hypothetical protein